MPLDPNGSVFRSEVLLAILGIRQWIVSETGKQTMANMFLCCILKEVKPSEPIELKGDSGTDEVRRSRQK